MERARSRVGFAVQPRNRGSDEDGVLTKSSEGDVGATHKGAKGVGWRELAGFQDNNTR